MAKPKAKNTKSALRYISNNADLNDGTDMTAGYGDRTDVVTIALTQLIQDTFENNPRVTALRDRLESGAMRALLRLEESLGSDDAIERMFFDRFIDNFVENTIAATAGNGGYDVYNLVVCARTKKPMPSDASPLAAAIAYALADLIDRMQKDPEIGSRVADQVKKAFLTGNYARPLSDKLAQIVVAQVQDSVRPMLNRVAEKMFTRAFGESSFEQHGQQLRSLSVAQNKHEVSDRLTAAAKSAAKKKSTKRSTRKPRTK